MFPRFLRTFLVIALIFAAIWTAVIWNWQLTHRYPSAGDIVLKLAVLPIGASAGYFLSIRLINFAKRWNATSESTKQKEAAIETPASPAAEAATQDFYLHLLTSSLRLPLGNDAESILSALEAGSGPRLDLELKDDDGFPIFAARVAGLAVEDTAAAIQTWDAAPRSWNEAQLRALALAEAALQDLAGRAAALFAADTIAGIAAQPILRTLFLFPDHWPREMLHSADEWLRHRLIQIVGSRVKLLGKVSAMHGGQQVIAALDGLSAMLNHGQSDDLCLVLACSSDVSEEAVAEWSRSGKLKSAAQRHGRIPGEGAAALLLRAAKAGAEVHSETPTVVLHRAALGKRGQSVDEQGRVSSETIRQVCEQALLHASTDARAVDCLLSDADERPARLVELGALPTTLLTEVSAERCYAIELGCGHLGAASIITAIALGAARVAATRKPAVIVSVADGVERAAVVLSAAA